MDTDEAVIKSVRIKDKGISGSTLKLIAIITMLVDHIGAVVLEKVINQGNTSQALFTAYYATRTIGRIAFPIFAFLLVEGFVHTRNQKKYATRLALFAVISEIPFDLALKGEMFYWGYQNVFFTLFISLIVMMGFKYVDDKHDISVINAKVLKGGCLIAGMIVATLMHTDYSFIGVACILILYITHNNKRTQTLVGCIAFIWELPAILAFIPIHFYNGKRGINLKYFFYIFYPAHLLILYFIAVSIKVV